MRLIDLVSKSAMMMIRLIGNAKSTKKRWVIANHNLSCNRLMGILLDCDHYSITE